MIHRDLAARNILVTNNLVLKISDFGLTRRVNSTKDYYRKITSGMLPIKWMAPESISRSIYSIRSDTWSFGVLLWEIFTFGDTPYPTIKQIDILPRFLHQGYRMERPENCSRQM